MRGWLMWRKAARSLTLTSPSEARRSRMRRRVGLANAKKWSGSSFRGLWRNIKVPLSNITHKGSVMYRRALQQPARLNLIVAALAAQYLLAAQVLVSSSTRRTVPWYGAWGQLV